MALARRLPRPRMTMLRLAIANIHRPGALTPSVVLSLGLGLAVLVTSPRSTAICAGSSWRRCRRRRRRSSSSTFRPPMPNASTPSSSKRAPQSKIEHVPMLRGRIVAARGVKAEELKPSPDAAWVLQSDRGLTYTGEMPSGSKVVEGEWWAPDYSGPPLVSFEKKLADGLG